MKEYKRLKENLNFLCEHNETNKPILIATLGQKTEKELIRELVSDCRDLLDKIEDGTLIELPCKVGDKLYSLYCKGYSYGGWYIKESCVDEIRLLSDGRMDIIEKQVDERGVCFYYYVDLSLFGKQKFLTKAEAEEILKGLQNER